MLNGPERAELLLVIASMDKNGDGSISDEELDNFYHESEGYRASMVGMLPPLAVAALLTVGLTHVHNIGRPSSWTPHPDAVELYGETMTEAFLTVTITISVVCECTAILVVVASIYYRLVFGSMGRMKHLTLIFMVRESRDDGACARENALCASCRTPDHSLSRRTSLVRACVAVWRRRAAAALG